jgi:molecular chaperone IbpA
MKVDENKYVIGMAVAGFAKQNLEIEVANSVLTIKGGLTVDDMAQESVANTQYIYKGIADRAFTRKMHLADTVVVQNAELINGMLRVFLENIIPESQKPQKVNIK